MQGTALVPVTSAAHQGSAAVFNSMDVQPLPDIPKDAASWRDGFMPLTTLCTQRSWNL